jgi:hypothetical protein
MSKERPDYRERLAYLREKYDKAFLTVPEAAKELSVCARTIRAMIERKVNPLPAINTTNAKCNKRYIISLEAIAKL